MNRYADLHEVEHLLEAIDDGSYVATERGIPALLGEAHECITYLVDEVRQLREESVE